MLKRNQRERRYKSVLERSFEIVEDFELNWKPEREDDLENALKGAKELAGEALFRRLLEIDLLLRIENGAALPKENYLARFPQYVETIKDVFAKLDELSAGDDEQEYPVPREFEHYRLEEFLGQGVTGCAYRATDLAMRRDVAFKFLNPKFDDAESLERFQRELAFNGRLDSDHIVRAYSCGKTADRNWLMMEYVDGDNLERYTLKAPECRLELDEALEIAEQVVLALQTIHDVGLVHRDLKPGNILRRKSDGVVKLSDLGFCVPIAAEKDDNQNQGRFYRPQSDYRGLGETFFFLTTGATFKEPITCPVDVVAVRRAYQKARTPVPSKAVLKFVARTLATDRSAQFASDEELLRTIRRLIQSQKLKITPARVAATVGAAIVALGICCGAIAFFAGRDDNVPDPPVQSQPPQPDDEQPETVSANDVVTPETPKQNNETPPVAVTPGETVSTVVTTPDDVVDPNDDLVSLREAINYAGTGDLGTTITFDSLLKGKTLTIREII
ncbi:MAG: serine/threonine protein kinase, partial [Thermoguttaceae bacterium]|nr:serine/threonine protein kinase [Thermoguttaceae bacterium]